jgi:hypothetical protein
MIQYHYTPPVCGTGKALNSLALVKGLVSSEGRELHSRPISEKRCREQFLSLPPPGTNEFVKRSRRVQRKDEGVVFGGNTDATSSS